jgi:hypothetical protein
MRTTTLVCTCAVALAASQAVLAPNAVARDATVGMGGATSDGAPSAEMKQASNSLSPSERDPAERSARSIECAQKADARGLQGKIRKHFLHQCRSGV